MSGGQTGVDRAALDVGIERGLEVGGWCPRGRLAEDGPISDSYPLAETPGRAYRQRTEWNVRDSDGTIVLAPEGVRSPGTDLTREMASLHGRPYLRLDPTVPGSEREGARWLAANDVEVVNVAGPRESERTGIYRSAAVFIGRLLDTLESE